MKSEFSPLDVALALWLLIFFGVFFGFAGPLLNL